MKSAYSRDSLGYYSILEADVNASAEDIKLRYRNKAKEWHPDHNKSPNAMEIFQKISVAYDVLSDDKKRLTYDLACLSHHSENFPDIFALKIYTNQKGEEDASVRILSQQQITGQIIKYKQEDKSIICNYSEALKSVLKISLHNWLLGWWSLKSFFKTPRVLIDNYKNINKNQEDIKATLIHNALAYEQEHKYQTAYACAAQAWDYASPWQKELLDKFIKGLPQGAAVPSKRWNYRNLKLIQLVIPFIAGLGLIFYLLSAFSEHYQLFNKNNDIAYYQEVKHWKGGSGVDDVVVAKIIEIRTDSNSTDMLYHVKEAYTAKVMYGPSDKFDELTTLPEGTTVRVTGISPDSVWLRVMLDNGDMGFTHKENLKKGIGLPVPAGSQVYTGNQ